MALVAGIDSSTQSTKVELREVAGGQVVGSGTSPHALSAPPASEQTPRTWWAALGAAMAEALSQAGGRSGEVVAVSVAGQQHGLVTLDDQCGLLRPAVLWNDLRPAQDATRLVERLGPAAWAEACGSVPVAAFTVAKLAWLGRVDPATFGRIAHVLLPHDWLTFRLTGRLVSDRGDASGTGYWSPSEERYRTDLLDLVSPDVEWGPMLPTVLGPREAAGELTVDAAADLGLAPGTPVACGTGDNMAAALGVGLRPGEVVVSIGTSGTVFTTSDHPTRDPTGAVAGFADATGRYLPLVCTLNAALVTEAVARLLAVDVRTLDEMALAAADGSGGLVLVPYLSGERTPNRPEATGALHGIRQDVGRDAVARAAYEGVVCSLLEGLDALAAAGAPPASGRLVLVGGGARSPAYRQVLAALSGRAVTVPSAGELVAAGAAVQAAALASGSGPEAIAERWDLRGGAVIEPGDGRAQARGIRERYAQARG